jgi:hypothetical protein
LAFGEREGFATGGKALPHNFAKVDLIPFARSFPAT